MRVNFYAVSALPGSLEPDSFYYVANGSVAESYLTDKLGNAKSVGNTVMINQLITAALASWEGANGMPIVADIAARDALFATATANMLALVIDASADPTVESGSALYAYDFGSSTVYKVAEYESMDLVIQWASIQGRLRKGSLCRFKRRVRRLQNKYASGDIGFPEIHQQLSSWVAHARHGEALPAITKYLKQHTFKRNKHDAHE